MGYIPYDDDLPSEAGPAHAYLRQLAQGIEVAMRANGKVSTQKHSSWGFPSVDLRRAVIVPQVFSHPYLLPFLHCHSIY